MYTTLKKKEEILGLDAVKEVTIISTQRPCVVQVVSHWINEKQLASDIVTENFICKEEKPLYANLVSKLTGMQMVNRHKTKMVSRSAADSLITFKRRSGIQSVVRNWEWRGTWTYIMSSSKRLWRKFCLMRKRRRRRLRNLSLQMSLERSVKH